MAQEMHEQGARADSADPTVIPFRCFWNCGCSRPSAAVPTTTNEARGPIQTSSQIVEPHRESEIGPTHISRTRGS